MMRALYFFLLVLVFTSCEKSLFTDKNNDPEYVFNSFWNELDRNYSFFTYANLNWDSVYSVYRPLISPNTSTERLFQIFSKITDLLNDAHTNVFTPYGVAGNTNYFEKYPINQITLKESYFESYQVNNKIFEYGTIKSSNIGYLKIKTFVGENKSFEEIDTLLNNFRNTKGLIIDVRSNRGGMIMNSEIIASRFADSARIACKYRIRNGSSHNDFSNWQNVSIAPAKNGFHYSKPLIILTNRSSYSATEWFILFADVIPKITIIGDTTGGGSAMPLLRELSNGWLLRTSNSQTILPSGRDFQCTGLYPDITVWISPNDAQKEIDTILEKAIAILSNL